MKHQYYQSAKSAKRSFQSSINCEQYYKPEVAATICAEFLGGDTVKTNKQIEYINAPCAFDIEASSFYEGDERRANMYAWALCLNGAAILGRTWREFVQCLETIANALQLSPHRRLIVYVQNLGYDFQFFRTLFEWEQVFSVEARRPCYAITKNGIEFRCSYILSGMSLEEMGKSLTRYKCRKLVGALDHELLRHSGTPLTAQEVAYCLNDVKTLAAYIRERIEADGDISKIPLTKTGYVRKRYRANCLTGKHEKYYTKLMSRLTLTPKAYKALKRAFQGGDVHANAINEGRIFSGVASYDFNSAYLATIVAEKFPMSAPIKYKPKSLADFSEMIEKYNCVFDIRFHDIRSTRWGHPISAAHCWNVRGAIEDNGRVVEADELSATITEVDFKTYCDFYEWEKIEVGEFYYFYKNYLPTPFVETALQLYKEKTRLKNVKGMEASYMRAKEDANATFGMMVTDIARTSVTCSGDAWGEETPNLVEAIEKYNTSRNRFLYYPWGVWVTAYARANLNSGIMECDADHIYNDTDSIKTLHNERHADYFSEYNKQIECKLLTALKYHKITDTTLIKPKTVEGVEKLLGAWDFEGVCDKFKTLGAKRYITQCGNDIVITVAGVGKTTGSEYIKTFESPFDAFDNNLIIPPDYTGKLMHTYIDKRHSGALVDYLGNVGKYEEASAVHMEKIPYHLSISDQYLLYLSGISMRDKR